MIRFLSKSMIARDILLTFLFILYQSESGASTKCGRVQLVHFINGQMQRI